MAKNNTVKVEVGDTVMVKFYEYHSERASGKEHNFKAKVIKKYENSAILTPLDQNVLQNILMMGTEFICVSYKQMSSVTGSRVAKGEKELQNFSLGFRKNAHIKKDAIISYCKAHPEATAKEIAEHVDSNYEKVYTVLKNAGLTPHKGSIYGKKIQPNLDHIKELIIAGYSQKEVSLAFGQNPKYISTAASTHADLRRAINEGNVIRRQREQAAKSAVMERANL